MTFAIIVIPLCLTGYLTFTHFEYARGNPYEDAAKVHDPKVTPA